MEKDFARGLSTLEATVLEHETRQQNKNENSAVSDRRAWVRYPCDLDSACQPLAGARGLQWPGKIRNLSAGGIVTIRAEVVAVRLPKSMERPSR